MEPYSNSLIVFLLLCTAAGMAFYILKTKRGKVKDVEAETFLASVLQSVDNIVNYYEPIFDGSGTISDFRIVYANECNREYLGLVPEEIIGRPVSEVFPYLFLNGEFEGLVESFINGRKVILDSQITIKGEKMWFKSIIKPLPKGVCVTARNTTPEISSEQNLNSMNNSLKQRNRELSDTVSFLNDVLKNTPGVIAYLEPVVDRSGETVDFEIIFASDAAGLMSQYSQGGILGRNLSEAFPFLMEREIFRTILECEKFRKVQVIEIEVPSIVNESITFDLKVNSTGSGITLTLSRIND